MRSGLISNFWNRFRDAYVYRPLAFAEPAESIELAQLGLKIQPGDTVAGITSSGDVLLSLLACQPRQVYGFDANPTQTALARMKQVLCASVTLDDAIGFLGLTQQSVRTRLQTWSDVRAQLNADAGLLERYELRHGILNCGMSRRLIQLMSLGFLTCLGREAHGRLFAAHSTAHERLTLHHQLGLSAPYRFGVRPLLHWGSWIFRHFLYPPAFCLNSEHPQKALQDLLAHFGRLFEVGFHENPVFCRHLTGHLPREQVQHLYCPEAWAILNTRANDIRFQTSTIEAGLRSLPPQSVDAFYLSNAPDYLHPQGLRALVESLSHAARRGARIYYLSLESRCPFRRSGIGTPFRRAAHIERELMQSDPVGLYPFVGVQIAQ